MKYITHSLIGGTLGFLFMPVIAVFMWVLLVLITIPFGFWEITFSPEFFPWNTWLHWWDTKAFLMLPLTLFTTGYGFIAGCGKALIEYEKEAE